MVPSSVSVTRNKPIAIECVGTDIGTRGGDLDHAAAGFQAAGGGEGLVEHTALTPLGLDIV
jgi:hypothetical protein